MNTVDIITAAANAYNQANVARDMNTKEPFGVNVRLAIGKEEDKLLYLPFSNDINFMQPMKLSISKNTPRQFINSSNFEKDIYNCLLKLAEQAKATGEKLICQLKDIDKDNVEMLQEAFGNHIWVVMTPKAETSETGEPDKNYGW